MLALEKHLGALLNKGNKNAQQREIARDRYHAKKLAKQNGIHLDVQSQPEWQCWICDERFADDQFCTSWAEVREKLEAEFDND